MSEKVFTIETSAFEGPLDLLLSLIKDRKLLINDISLARVAEAYFEHINSEEQQIEEVSEFLVIASSLVLIKSKSLLPSLEYTDTEEESIEELRTRLSLYEIINECAQILSELEDRLYSVSHKAPEEEVVFRPADDLSLENIECMRTALIVHLPKKEKNPEVLVKQTVSLEEVIERVEQQIRSMWQTSFDNLVSSKEEKVLHIVHFLAILELAKQGSIALNQSERFGTIQIEQQSLDTPSYGAQ